jgi:hypothetical protein
MRKKIFILGLFAILLGTLGIITPVDAIPPERVWFPLEDDVTGNRIDGGILIDPAHAHYSTRAYVGEQNGKLYYELKAYNPSGTPTTITWGMTHANMNGRLRFNGKFDSNTLAWINTYGLTGTTYSVRPIE